MKKAPAVVALVFTVIALLGTVSFYIMRNTGTTPLHIRSLIPSNISVNIPGETSPAAGNLLNINTADTQQLATLPGIGNVLAQRIIDYRAEHGPFHSPAELLNVPGIGEKKLEGILNLITTGGNT